MFSIKKTPQNLSKKSVSKELDTLLNDLTIKSNDTYSDSKSTLNVESKPVLSDLEKQIEENQILCAKIMNERLGGRY